MTAQFRLVAAVVLVAATAGSADADIVLDWNAIAARSIVTVGGQVPPRAMTRLAMVHLAVYDAVNAIEGHPFRSYAARIRVTAPASRDAAVATAAHDVLVALLPAQAPDLDASYLQSLAAVPEGPAKMRGIEAGRAAAAAILARRANDGRDDVVTYVPGAGPGAWAPTPPALLPAQAPELPLVQPFTLKHGSQFRPDAPLRLDSRRWARDLNEVKALGGSTSTARTAEQTDIARFWSDNPALQWNRAWRTLADEQRLGVLDNARYFAMLTTVSADALIACWDAKFFYGFWRPVTAIRAADTDGNALTTPDPAWLGIVPTPNHPEYPAGHGCLSGAVSETLREFFASDKVPFTIDSNAAGLLAPIRRYDRFSEALEEVLAARIYGGMHYRNSLVEGAKLGERVSRYATRRFFRPGHKRSADNHR